MRSTVALAHFAQFSLFSGPAQKHELRMEVTGCSIDSGSEFHEAGKRDMKRHCGEPVKAFPRSRTGQEGKKDDGLEERVGIRLLHTI